MSPPELSQAHASPDSGSLRSGKSGVGAAAAMAQIRRDRLAELHLAPTPEEQIRGLWLARAASDRRLTAVRDLHAWLTANAPELLNGQPDPQAYLLRLLAADIDPGPQGA